VLFVLSDSRYMRDKLPSGTISFNLCSNFQTDIEFSSGKELSSELQNLSAGSVCLVDEKVYNLYNDSFLSFFEEHSLFFITATEKEKNFAVLQKIIAFLAEKRVPRNASIIAVGGGITLDIAAFAASIYNRGCKLILIPTTFLAMIDAAIGGKTGINFLNRKNIIGSFYPATRVLITLDFLNTLEPLELLNGWAECIKVSLLTPNDLYDMIINPERKISESLIRKAINLKIRFCRNDLQDKGERQKLNLGHTIAHLIETVSDNQIPHGIAVSIGIRAIARYSREKGFIDSKTENAVSSLLDVTGFPPNLAKIYYQAVKNQGREILELDKKSRQPTPQTPSRSEVRLNNVNYLVIFTGFQETELYQCRNVKELIATLLSL